MRRKAAEDLSRSNHTRPKLAARELSGADKVAALLLVMGKPLADRIIKQLEDREIRALARSAMELPSVGLDSVEALVGELARQLDADGDAIAGSTEDAQGLLAGVISDEAVGEIMDELSGQPPRRIWEKLARVADEKLAAFLAEEQPQVAAFVLSNLDVEKASAVMEKLDAGLRANLSRRLLSMKPIADPAARLVADRLSEALLGEEQTSVSERNNHARLGAILNQLEREQSAEILGQLSVSQPEDARKVRAYVFAFEDLARLAPEDLGRLLDEVPAERLVTALRGSDGALLATVLAALSPRSRRLVEAELGNEVKVPAKAISAARRAIAGLALSLAERSMIRLGAAVDDAGSEPAPEQAVRPAQTGG